MHQPASGTRVNAQVQSLVYLRRQEAFHKRASGQARLVGPRGVWCGCINLHRCVKWGRACMQSLPGFTRQKAYRKRASGRARFLFPGGYKMAVSMYSLVQPATKSSPVFLNALNNEPLKVESAFIDQDTGTYGLHGLVYLRGSHTANQLRNAFTPSALLVAACSTWANHACRL